MLTTSQRMQTFFLGYAKEGRHSLLHLPFLWDSNLGPLSLTLYRFTTPKRLNC